MLPENWGEWFLFVWFVLMGALLAKAGVAYWRYLKARDDDDDNEMGV
jgi:hypothetical protein